MIRNITKHLLSQQKIFISLRNKASTANINDKDLERLALEPTEVIEEDDQIKAEEIEKRRNKSRLHEAHRNIVHNKIPYLEPAVDFQKTLRYQRKVYGNYGEQSGINPAICWPTKSEIQDIKEYEKITFPYTIQEMMAQVAENRKIDEETRQKRQEDVMRKFAKLEQWKKDLRDKITKKEAEARVAKERKDRLVEEVRRHFGYKIDPKDERFKEMLEQKEKAEKKAMKEAKRKVKEAKMIAKLQQNKTEINAEIAESENQETSDKDVRKQES